MATAGFEPGTIEARGEYSTTELWESLTNEEDYFDFIK